MSIDEPRTLKGCVVMVTGACRGVGAAIAVRATADGAAVALLANTDTPNPKFASTLGHRRPSRSNP